MALLHRQARHTATHDVTVELSPHNDGSRAVHVQWDGSQSSATFTPDNWDTPQTVYIWGNHDVDRRYRYGVGWENTVTNTPNGSTT